MEISTVTNTIKTPTFANNSVPVNDPTTGKPNFFASEEVSSDEKLNGFTPAYSKPTRQTFNTLFRVIDKQITWLKETFFPKVKADIETLDSRLGVKTDSASATSDKAHPRIKDLQNRLGQDIDIDTTAFGLANKALGYINSHNHDGGSGTDHAEKVMLTNAAEVQGILPNANISNSLKLHTNIDCTCSVAGKQITINAGSKSCILATPGVSFDYSQTYIYEKTTPEYNVNIIDVAGTGWAKLGDGGIVYNTITGFTNRHLYVYAVYDPTNDSKFITAYPDVSFVDEIGHPVYVGLIGRVFVNKVTNLLVPYEMINRVGYFKGDYISLKSTGLISSTGNTEYQMIEASGSTMLPSSEVGYTFGNIEIAAQSSATQGWFTLKANNNESSTVGTTNSFATYSYLPSNCYTSTIPLYHLAFTGTSAVITYYINGFYVKG